MSKKIQTKKVARVVGSKVTPRPRATASTAGRVARRRSEFPAHLGTTPKEWRALKRTEWREVMQAIARYELGSAFCPAGNALYHLGKLAYQVDEALKPNDWIAW